MEQYPKRFIQAGLIYAVLAALLGVTIAIMPDVLQFVFCHASSKGNGEANGNHS